MSGKSLKACCGKARPCFMRSVNWFIEAGIKSLIAFFFVIFLLAVGTAMVALWETVVSKGFTAIVGEVQALSMLAVSAGVLMAILTFAKDRKRLAAEREENRSRILLEQAKEGLDEAYELLKDQNNTRVIWVRAARVLLEATARGREIKDPDLLEAYRLYEDRMRSRFYRALTIYNEETKERKALPPQFFYGIDDWKREMSLDEAASESSSRTQVYTMSIDGVPPEPMLHPLPPAAIVAVFDFLQYPSDYVDPLKRVATWRDSWESSFGPSQGARRYVGHADATYAINGQVYRREGGGDAPVGSGRMDEQPAIPGEALIRRPEERR